MDICSIEPFLGMMSEQCIKTNVEVYPNSENGLTKKSIADCLQTRPIDYRVRLIKIRGQLNLQSLKLIDQSLKIVFDLH